MTTNTMPKAQAPAPQPVPPGFMHLPTGKLVYWTGRVAIGIRHHAQRFDSSASEMAWLQGLLLTPAATGSAL